MPARNLTSDERRRVAEQLALAELVRRSFPSERGMYAAHLRVIPETGDATDVLFGAGSNVRVTRAPSVNLVDWQRSPWTRVLLSCNEGDTYELRSRGEVITGKVVERNLVRFEGRELVEIMTGDERLVRSRGDFVRASRPGLAFLDRSRAARKRPRTLIDVDLDPAQQGAVTLPAGQSVLLLGEAGHGKTTVALHRLRHLMATASFPIRAAMLVPTEGLRRLIQPLVRRLGIDVEVMLYETWAKGQAQESFPDIPEVESQNATAGVIRIKRDPALRPILERLARRRPGRVNDDREAGRVRSKAHARRGDLQHLFGDRALMRELALASRQRIGAAAVDEVLEHTHVQFSERAEKEFAHVVDRERLIAVDRRSIDAGTPMEDAATIDAEDYAILFELDRLRALRKKLPPTEPRHYDCILLDEAQELAPLELALIGRSLAPSGMLIVAGDADQQVDPDVSFESWEHTMRELGMSSYERIVLEVGYRCPPAVVALGRAVLERGSPSEEAPAVDDRPTFHHFDNELLLVDWLAGELRDLGRRDRRATSCIICRSPLTARRLHGMLRFGSTVSLVLDGRFVFGPTGHVTTVEQVKGLEFDYVIVPDASASTYPDDAPARRALYVALTRARHQVLLAAVGPRSPILERTSERLGEGPR